MPRPLRLLLWALLCLCIAWPAITTGIAIAITATAEFAVSHPPITFTAVAVVLAARALTTRPT